MRSVRSHISVIVDMLL